VFTDEQLLQIRTNFPSLTRQQSGKPVVYFDGPAGSQVPQRVVNRIANSILHHSANRSGKFATSREVDHSMAEAHSAGADFFGASDPREIVFGANMTTMTLHFSRSLSQLWQPGDEIVVSRLDHDANVTPWVLAARDRNVTVRYVDVNLSDCTLNEIHFAAQLNPKTRLVAFTCASNSIGSKTAIKKLVNQARQVGAMTYLDATHYAPHERISVQDWGADFVACSAYKFYGPHIGMIWGRKKWLDEIRPYKLRPSPDAYPASWMTGTQNHPCIAGVTEAIEYIADIGRTLQGDQQLARSAALDAAYEHIRAYEQGLIWQLLDGLQQIPGINVYGITDRNRNSERVPTLAFTAAGFTSAELAQRLGDEGIYAWHGNYYALQLSEQLQMEPAGMLRLGIMHYNTSTEVQRCLDTIATIMKR
jgi:cysteine desulfurase family protein (TIGR01976 family)